MENAFVVVVIIFLVNIVYVTFSTIRMILTLKGRRYLAALVSTVEVVVYIIGLSLVLDNLNGIQNVIAYAAGYALGIIVGSIIEERLALGYITVNVISSHPELEFSATLREKGFGVTSWISSGMDGDRLSMQILTSRKRELTLYKAISEIDTRAFIVSYEPKHIQGGFWVKQVRNRGKFTRGEEKVLKDMVPTEKVTEEGEVMEESVESVLSQINPSAEPTEVPAESPKVTPKR